MVVIVLSQTAAPGQVAVLAALVPVEWEEVQVGQIKITRKIREQ